VCVYVCVNFRVGMDACGFVSVYMRCVYMSVYVVDMCDCVWACKYVYLWCVYMWV
jgi:hypothetical protein